MSYPAIIDRLERDLRQYRIEFQRFFNGDVAVPPEELRNRIRKQLTHLISQPQLSSVDQFRLGALEGKYNSLTDLYRRRLRDATNRPSVRGPGSEVLEVELGTESDVDEVRQLFDAVYADRSPTIDLEQFHAHLSRKVALMRDKTGCKKVRFSVDADAGKLKVRPVRR